MDKNPLYSVWLSLALGPGSRIVTALFSHFETAEEVYHSRKHLPEQLPLSYKERSALASLDILKAEEIMETCERLHFSILTCEDPEYPARLREIYDFPVVLYQAGRQLNLEERLCICVVGTRNPTPYALKATQMIVTQLTEMGILVMSGLAVGIDATAAGAAIKAGGETVAVVGAGLDINYPRQNENLHRAIQKRGTVLSEFPPGTSPSGWHFPIRNRILSGLCDGVFMVEGTLRSGALLTASHAVEQGRDVFTLPGDIFNAKADGAFQLLKDGAIPVRSGLDILETYLAKYPEYVAPEWMSIEQNDLPPKKKKTKNGLNSFKHYSNLPDTITKDTNEQMKAVFEPAELSPLALILYERLKEGPLHADILSQEIEGEASVLLGALTELEMEGLVVTDGGRVYKRTK